MLSQFIEHGAECGNAAISQAGNTLRAGVVLRVGFHVTMKIIDGDHVDLDGCR
ncbi:hypothetical protein D3C81_2321520 [compost metagenome]